MEELQDGDPQQVGRYTLLARLGSGGMGQVYLGRSLGGRQVAVKVIRSDLARDRDFRARFAREVEAASRVNGAFTAPVIDADPDALLPWLVTGYVKGPSLADAVNDHGPLPTSSVLTLAAGLAEGLAAVHEVGVIHRDLKPSNVLLAPDGPRLIDFGISHAADFAHVTATGMVIGTPGFMSPEQALGVQVGPASDIFSLGAVLAFAATGEGPYGIGSPEARQHRVAHSAPRLDNLPEELRPLVAECMAVDPATRPTASQFLADVVAAHPLAANQTDWLPASFLAGAGSPPMRSTPAPRTPSSALSAPQDPPSARETPAPSQGWEPTVTKSTPPPKEAVTPRPHPADLSSDRTDPLPPAAQTRPQREGESSIQRELTPLIGSVQSARQQFPQVTRQDRPPVTGERSGNEGSGKRSRRPWVIAAVALVAVAGVIIGLVVSSPSSPPVLQPTGLLTSDLTSQSVQLAWSGPASGPVPTQYEILQNGTEVGSVPGSTTDYQDSKLSPDTAYKLSVIAVRGAKQSTPSSTLTVTTINPPLSDAVLNYSGTVDVEETIGSYTETLDSKQYPRDVGDTWQDTWKFTPNCSSGACNVTLSGAVSGSATAWPFTAQLTRNGSTYTGSVAMNDFWFCGTNQSDREDATLSFQIAGTAAGTPNGVWTVTSFSGTAIWTVDPDPDGDCSGSTYGMQVHN